MGQQKVKERSEFFALPSWTSRKSCQDLLRLFKKKHKTFQDQLRISESLSTSASASAASADSALQRCICVRVILPGCFLGLGVAGWAGLAGPGMLGALRGRQDVYKDVAPMSRESPEVPVGSPWRSFGWKKSRNIVYRMLAPETETIWGRAKYG